MQAYKTEEYYYIRASLLPSGKNISQANSHVQRVGNIKFKHPSFLDITLMKKQGKENYPSYDSCGASSQFYQISLKKPLSNTQLMNHLTMSWSLPQVHNQKTENTFKIRLSDIIKAVSNKENFTEKQTIISADSTRKMQLLIIPSYNELTTEILDKIISHEDSKLTVDTFSRLDYLSTQQSLGQLQRKNKFKRTSRQCQLRLEKKSKSPDLKHQVIFKKDLKRDQLSPVYVKQHQSPVKRHFRMRRSQLIPQDFKCQMEQIDEYQTLQYYRKNASNVAYIIALLLQFILIIKLMTPSSKV